MIEFRAIARQILAHSAVSTRQLSLYNPAKAWRFMAGWLLEQDAN